MSSNKLLALRDWLTLQEAAIELSAALSEEVLVSDVLRLAIDQHLTLSLYLPTRMTAWCTRPHDDSGGRQTREPIEGLCDVPMKGRAKAQIEHDYHWLRDRKFVPRDEPVGALVEDRGRICQLPPDQGQTGLLTRSPSEFPEGSVLAVRRSALNDFVGGFVREEKHAKSVSVERPLRERERGTLLTIIAALCKAVDLDLSRPSKAAESIEQ